MKHQDAAKKGSEAVKKVSRIRYGLDSHAILTRSGLARKGSDLPGWELIQGDEKVKHFPETFYRRQPMSWMTHIP
jgi:hypothetical protein